jgi:hypothetical protein
MVQLMLDFRLFYSLLGPGQEQKAENPLIFFLALKGTIGFSNSQPI